MCTALLVASLTAAVGASPPHPTASSEDPAPGPGNPQTLPHGSPNLALPDLVPPPGTGKPGPGGPGSKEEVKGIPATALAAYKNAERYAKERWPDCHVPWELIAAIGKVESDHGAMGGGLRPDGSTEKAIIGPPLTGEKFALVRDTDGGRWDGDTQYDHAVGPMQFIPSTWASYSADGRNAGQNDPNNIFDAAAGTARYLCAGGLDLSKQADLEKAVLRYNSSRQYLNTVVAWMTAYRNGEGGAIPDPSGGPSTGTTPYPGTTPRPTVPVPTGPGTVPPRTTPSTTTPERPDGTRKPDDRGRPKDPDKSRDRDGDKGQGEHKKPKPPAPRAVRLDRMDGAELTAHVGETFEHKARVRALTADGKGVPGTRVRFKIVGADKALFKDGTDTFVASAGKDGIATSPAIRAGDKTGEFYILATLEGRDAKAVEFDATVTPAPAPKAARFTAMGGDLRYKPGESVPRRAIAKAYDAKGRPVDGVKVTVTVKKDGHPADNGPSLKDKDKLVRTVTVTTREGGLVFIDGLAAGNQEGAFTLELSTDDKEPVTLSLEVTVKSGATDKPTDKPTTPGKPADKKPAPGPTSTPKSTR
ncbi:hypothetical protein AC230_00505 [Streptomyces caatingaensis]|uniref:Transglycosylase SLT domain-containing protein n=1 Tax=Streptomyces caatingaensis TaxID=1678637 RepID=A0A0K9XMW8_9ACTN|nr:hypothetical protein AC230_00505 [Streptomyces caatingaensis]